MIFKACKSKWAVSFLRIKLVTKVQLRLDVCVLFSAVDSVKNK